MSRKTQLLSLVLAAVAVMANQHVMSTDHAADDGPKPMWNKDTMPPVSTTMHCIINLSCQYFIVMTALALGRTYQQNFGGAVGINRVLEAAKGTIQIAPMICVMFLGIRMRAIQLSGGHTEVQQLPQDFVKQAMQTCSFAVLLQVLVIMVIPIFTGEASVPTDDDGNVDIDRLEKQLSPAVVIALNFIRYATMIALYGGFAVCVYGVYTMRGSSKLWEDGEPPVSPAVNATINLTVQFFVIYLAQAIVRTAIGFKGSSQTLVKIDSSLTLASFTVHMAPMLCILFIGCRMRALQIDPKHGEPEEYAQNCFYWCAYSVLVQTLLVVFLPFLVPGVTCKQGLFEGDVVYEGLTGWVATLLTIVRYVAVVALYGGFSAVVYSCFNQTDSGGEAPPMAPSLLCMMNLAAQYFFIHLLMCIFTTVRQFAGTGGQVVEIMDQAQKTVLYAPMLSVLFLGVRMRALQIARDTKSEIPAGAGPSSHTTQCMYACTWAVLVQVVLVIILGSLYPIEMDLDGNVMAPKGVHPAFGHVLNFIRYVCMISMYGGACYILYDAVTMTPEMLPPYNTEKAPLVDMPGPIPDIPGPTKPEVFDVKGDGKSPVDTIADAAVPDAVEKAVSFFF